MWTCRLVLVSWPLLALVANPALAGGGPVGIDHKLSYDNSGIWKRSNQTALLDLMIAGEFVGGLWEGGESRLGRTYWQAIDASLLAGLSAQPLKYAFARARPTQTDDPNAWFQGRGHFSFPSGEVAAVSAIVTPFVLEYGAESPSVYALEALPLYDAIARMKVQAHWQTDVLAGFALGTVAGYYARHRDSPFVLSLMPHAVFIGFRKSW
jgi:membrane-associated phospholipid phosphatase